MSHATPPMLRSQFARGFRDPKTRGGTPPPQNEDYGSKTGRRHSVPTGDLLQHPVEAVAPLILGVVAVVVFIVGVLRVVGRVRVRLRLLLRERPEVLACSRGLEGDCERRNSAIYLRLREDLKGGNARNRVNGRLWSTIERH